MGSKKQDRARIGKAATDVANKDYPHFKAAVQYTTEYTALGVHAFGMASSTALLPRYTAARDTQVQNLEDGLQKFEEAIRGLLEVAYRMSATEAAASTIDFANPAQVWQTKVRTPSGLHDEGFRTNAPLLRVTEASTTGPDVARLDAPEVHLQPLHARPRVHHFGFPQHVVQRQAGRSRHQPCHGGLAGGFGRTHLVGLNLMASDAGGPLPRSVRDDDARDAFDQWVTNFQDEVWQASKEAVDAANALGGTLEDIHEIQSIRSS